jgi:predicted secreted protein
MAVFSGKNLVVKFGSDTLTHVRSATVTSAINTVDITAAADTYRGIVTTVTSFEASVEMLYDDTTDLFDTELAVGASATLIVNPEGTATGQIKISGTAIVTGVEFSVPYDGVVVNTVSFTSNSALTIGTN